MWPLVARCEYSRVVEAEGPSPPRAAQVAFRLGPTLRHPRHRTMPVPRAVSVPLPRLLSLLPNDGVGARVYAARWAAKGLPVPVPSPAAATAAPTEDAVCYWDVKKVRLHSTENGHVRGRAYGVLNWKGTLLSSPSLGSLLLPRSAAGLKIDRVHEWRIGRQARDARRIRADPGRAQVPLAGGDGPARARRGGQGDRGTKNGGSDGGGASRERLIASSV